MFYAIYWKMNTGTNFETTEPAFDIFKTKKDRLDYYNRNFKDSKYFEDENPQFIDILPEKLSHVVEDANPQFHGRFYEIIQSYPIVDQENTFKRYHHIFTTKKARQRYNTDNIRGKVLQGRPSYFVISGFTITNSFNRENEIFNFH